MKRSVVWRRVDTIGLEYAEFEFDPFRIDGDVIVIENGIPFSISYRIEYDENVRTSAAFVRLRNASGQRECRLLRGHGDQWTMNGTPMPQLNGLLDVDLSLTPSTNTAPIRRLQLSIGKNSEVITAWIKFPTLNVVPLRQIYRRVGINDYEYKAPDLDFAANLKCNDEDIVQTYGDLWYRAD